MDLSIGSSVSASTEGEGVDIFATEQLQITAMTSMVKQKLSEAFSANK